MASRLPINDPLEENYNGKMAPSRISYSSSFLPTNLDRRNNIEPRGER